MPENIDRRQRLRSGTMLTHELPQIALRAMKLIIAQPFRCIGSTKLTTLALPRHEGNVTHPSGKPEHELIEERMMAS